MNTMNWCAPPFSVRGRLANIERTLHLLLQKANQIMQTTTDLTTAVADLQTEVTAIGTQMDTLLADLVAARAANDPVAVDAAVTAIKAQVDALKAAGTRDMPVVAPVVP